MEELAINYYKSGYNCSQCLVKAAEQYYKIPVPGRVVSMLSGVSTGFGAGMTCSVLIAAVMVFGLLFDEQTVKHMRARLLDEFHTLAGTTGCQALRRVYPQSCEALIRDVARITERIIKETK